ncbi:MAG: 3-dehydroquinate synthase, partial [Firmicutes bacterium]|nr:3-dehydroquinate synthase [Bacillota bacterium]
VNADLYESNQRMFLNFGHTVAHGLENVVGYGVLKHGEAVGLGSLVALYLSEQILGLSPDIRQVVTQWLKDWQLPREIPLVHFADLQEAMRRDKKARQFGLQWVLLRQLGHPEIVRDVPCDMVEAAVSHFMRLS